LLARYSAALFGVVAFLFHATGTAPAFAEELDAGQTAIVTGTEGGGMRVRKGPGMSYGIVTTAKEGTKVEIIATPITVDGVDWYQVSVGTSTTGWSSGKYLSSGAASSGPTMVAMSTTSADGQRTFIAKMTAYADGVGGVPMGARTYSGTRTRWGVVAVDPKIVPLGSQLTIEGYEGTVFTAEDVGGSIRGEAVDIWLPNARDARTYGTQYRRVTVIREGPAR
jgi:3D (Asp-Asp-Asp) domain-containing protein